MNQPKKNSTRGFASMDKEKQIAIARKGGASVPREKRSFARDPLKAAEAGRKGGLVKGRTRDDPLKDEPNGSD